MPAAASTDEHDDTPGRGFITLVLVILVAIFSFFVGYGWFHLFRPVVGNFALALFLAIMWTLLALLFAYYMGFRSARARRQGVRRSRSWTVTLVLYPVLFAISALGTVNSAFYWFQGSSILQEKIDQVQVAMRQLDSAAQSVLGANELQAKRQRVEAQLASLRQEIVNPWGRNLCGVGDDALAIIAAIRAELPSYRPIRDTVGRNDCAQIDEVAIYNSYEQQAFGILDAQASRILPEMRRQIGQEQASLQGAEDNLDGFSAGNLDETRYMRAQESLRSAATRYADIRTTLLDQASPDQRSQLPAQTEIDVSRAMDLGSILSIVSTLWDRSDRIPTWVALGAAIGLDFLLIYFFGLLCGGGGRARERIVPPPPFRDPQFLWVNPR